MSLEAVEFGEFPWIRTDGLRVVAPIDRAQGECSSSVTPACRAGSPSTRALHRRPDGQRRSCARRHRRILTTEHRGSTTWAITTARPHIMETGGERSRRSFRSARPETTWGTAANRASLTRQGQVIPATGKPSNVMINSDGTGTRPGFGKHGSRRPWAYDEKTTSMKSAGTHLHGAGGRSRPPSMAATSIRSDLLFECSAGGRTTVSIPEALTRRTRRPHSRRRPRGVARAERPGVARMSPPRRKIASIGDWNGRDQFDVEDADTGTVSRLFSWRWAPPR